jgi:amidase
MPEELHWLSLLDVSDRIAAGVVSPLELTRALLARIERIDPVLRSYATVTPDQALAGATRAEQEIRRGERRGPLHGVPIAVKDLCARRGVPTAAGMALLRDRRPEVDSTVVARLEKAGAVLLGQLQLTEGASVVHHPTIEPPRNPWNLERSPGGSSSGSGVATAAGLCFGSLGSDTAGSIRIPSFWCGVAGLKPTWGRVSRFGVFPLAETLDCIGPMARRVGDLAALLGVLAGPDAADPTASRRRVPDYLAGLADGISGVRIGVDEAYVMHDTMPELGRAVLASGAVFGELGATMRSVRLPDMRPATDAAITILSAECAHAHETWFPARASEYGPHLRELIDEGRALTARDYAAAQAVRETFRGQLATVFEEIDLLLCPPMFVPASPTSIMAAMPGRLSMFAEAMRFTAPWNLSGSPTLTMCCGYTADHLPLALQLVARPFEEELVLRAGHAYESATEWHRRHPRNPAVR